MKPKFVILDNNKLSQFWKNRKKGLGMVFSRVSFHKKISISDNFEQDLVVAWHNWHCLLKISIGCNQITLWKFISTVLFSFSNSQSFNLDFRLLKRFVWSFTRFWPVWRSLIPLGYMEPLRICPRLKCGGPL